MENKKTKLTISGNPKKSFKDFNSPKPQGKNLSPSSRGFSKSTGKGNFKKPTGAGFKSSSNFGKSSGFKPNFPPKTPSTLSDFERRKLAEQRATKRLKGDSDKDKKSKLDIKKRHKTHSF